MPPLTRLERTLIAANRRFGRFVPQSIKRCLANWLIPSDKPLRFLNVDIVGTCNLRCPSCPVGNMGQINPTGLMSLELFQKVIEKARSEHRVYAVGLFNWGEPMLHPQLPDFVRATKKQGLDCHISSNLNILRNADDILDAGPDMFRISLSGFTQSTYGSTHAGGNIDKVKANMRTLSDARARKPRNRTRIVVYYHKYRNNLTELPLMKEYARSLGFDWMETWAYYMPLERVLELVEGDASVQTQEYVESTFALPIVDAVAAARDLEGTQPCTLLHAQLTLDHNANVILCCGTYDYSVNTVGSFLSMSDADISAAKSGHATCNRCATHGVHRYGTYYDSPRLVATFDEMAASRVTAPVESSLSAHV